MLDIATGAVDTTPPQQTREPRRPSPYIGPERRSEPPLARGPADLRDGLAWMLDEVDYGMVLLDASAQVLHANHNARAEMEGSHPLQCIGSRLQARRPQDKSALAQALRRAACGRRRCLLTLGDQGRAAMVAVVPLGPRLGAPQPGQGMGPTTLLVFGKRMVCEALSVHWFSQQHRLTLAEAQVLKALCDGAAPGDVAAQQGVALSTVRTQISSIRAKTGADSLRALVRQVAVLPPLLSALRQMGP
jgi:DNA-binding CsgD family transcriptional regulator